MRKESSDNESYIILNDYLPQEPVDMVVVLTLIVLAFYYVWRAAYLTPWYDELYTYYYFISRGPLYAAIHWPLPNNHVGYSVLSAILDFFGNSYVGLRGVSFVCALLNPYLVFRICKRYMDKWMSYGAMILYVSCMLVNELAVQGRGYTLATTCFLISIRQLCLICSAEEFKLKDYVIFSASLVLGLYTLPSSIYWVLPTCTAAGLFLIINGYRTLDRNDPIWKNRYFKKLKRCIIAGLVAAGITFMLYLIIWLAIGSNLLVKEEGSLYYGMSHVQMILRHPFKSAFQGIEYMLSQPYIQSVERAGYLNRFREWIVNLSMQMFPDTYVAAIIIVMCGLIILFSECLRHFENSRTIFSLIVLVNSIGFQLILILQAKLPYFRVFSYMGVISAISIAVVIEHLNVRLEEKFKDKMVNERLKVLIYYLPIVITFLFVISSILKPEYYAQYGDRESDCYNALYIARPDENKKLCVLDCDQEYLLKFGFDVECTNTDVYDCDYVLIDRNMMKEAYHGYDDWKFYQNYDTIPWDYINSEMHIFYENEYFVLYKR